MTKILTGFIKSCENAFSSITFPEFVLPARFLQLKLILLVKYERFGCELSYKPRKEASEIANVIKKGDQYLGYLAWSEIYL